MRQRSDTSTCKSCGAAIRWVTTLMGSRMPIDPEPSKQGNVLLVRGGTQARVVKSGADCRHLRERGDKLYTTHFVTCPQAGEHRRPRRSVQPRRASR